MRCLACNGYIENDRCLNCNKVQPDPTLSSTMAIKGESGSYIVQPDPRATRIIQHPAPGVNCSCPLCVPGKPCINVRMDSAVQGNVTVTTAQPEPRDARIAELEAQVLQTERREREFIMDCDRLAARIAELEESLRIEHDYAELRKRERKQYYDESNSLIKDRDRLAARVAELEAQDTRRCSSIRTLTEKVVEFHNDRDRLVAQVAELERETNRWQDVANETAANYWRLTEERNRLRLALDAVHVDSVACAPESGPKQYCITEWALSKVREALAGIPSEKLPNNYDGIVSQESQNSDTSGAPVAGADRFDSRLHAAANEPVCPRCDGLGCYKCYKPPKPDPTAARLTPEVCSDEIRGLVEWVHGLTIREARELRRMWEARAEHAALLRVAKAALDYWAYETKTNREGLRAALTDLRRARAGKDGGSDG